MTAEAHCLHTDCDWHTTGDPAAVDKAAEKAAGEGHATVTRLRGRKS